MHSQAFYFCAGRDALRSATLFHCLLSSLSASGFVSCHPRYMPRRSNISGVAPADGAQPAVVGPADSLSPTVEGPVAPVIPSPERRTTSPSRPRPAVTGAAYVDPSGKTERPAHGTTPPPAGPLRVHSEEEGERWEGFKLPFLTYTLFFSRREEGCGRLSASAARGVCVRA